MTAAIDWSKAGTRLRVTPKNFGDKNPDWNWAESRWKTLEEYAAASLTSEQVVEKAACSVCEAAHGAECVDTRKRLIGPHIARRTAAGAALVAEGWKL